MISFHLFYPQHHLYSIYPYPIFISIIQISPSLDYLFSSFLKRYSFSPLNIYIHLLQIDEDDEKDEVDMAFSLLKTRFKEADSDRDDSISSSQFKHLLGKFTPQRSSGIPDSLIDKIFTTIGVEAIKGLSFKQYLYGIYLFVTEK